MQLAPEDELVHKPGPEPAWREAFYLDFADPATGISCLCYKGAQPNQERGDSVFAVIRNGEVIHYDARYQFPIARSDAGVRHMDFGPLQFSLRKPMNRWEIRYKDGGTRMDVQWNALHEPYDYPWSELTNSRHYEHTGRIQGQLTVGNLSVPIDTLAVRDHAWGARSAMARRGWLWCHARLSPELICNVNILDTAAGPHLFGYLVQDGQLVPLRHAEVETEYHPERRHPARTQVRVTDSLGRRLELESEVTGVVDLSSRDPLKPGEYYFAFSRFAGAGLSGTGMNDYYWATDEYRRGVFRVGTP